jgi:eukaryotic-like serine/threonine-protein kinase
MKLHTRLDLRGKISTFLRVTLAQRHDIPLLDALTPEAGAVYVMALEKERERRDETADGLAADLGRSLAGEPVTAAPPGAGYRARKFVQRHRAAIGVSAAVGLALVSGLAGVAWQAAATRAERDKAQVVAEFMADILGGVAPSVARGRDTTMLREMLPIR